MFGALVSLLTTGALLTAGGLTAASLRLRSLTAYMLATYIISWAELVGVVAILSPAHLVERWALVTSVAALLVIALIGWSLAGRPAAPSWRAPLQTLRSLLRDPALAILAGAVALGFGYLLALALFTPPNSIDALWYHLPRAAMWLQQHGVGYIPDANDARLNGNPPVAEIGLLYTMALSGVDRFVTLVSLSAYGMLPLTVFGLARRLGVETRAAVCAGLAFATVPVLLLQASTAKNDLVLASFAAACAYFCLGTRRAETVLAGLARALALGTKIYAPLVLPIIALGVVAGVPRRRVLTLAAVAVPSVLAGATWNVVNLAQTGSVFGDLSDRGGGGGGSGAGGAFDFVAVTVRYLIDFAELPGAAGWRLAGYVAAPVVVGMLLLRGRSSRGPLVAAALLAALPALILAFTSVAPRAYRYVLFEVGRPGLGILDYNRGIYAADPMSSYYGPLGVALLLLLFVLLPRRRSIPGTALAFAAAPLLFVIGISLFVGYSNTSGRFYVFAVALAAAASGVFLWSRPVLWAVVALAVPTVVLTLAGNVEKAPSSWGEPRWLVQTHVGPNNDETRLIEYAAKSLPRHTRLGLALGATDISYPFFDAHLKRRVRFVSSLQTNPPDVDWLVVSPRRFAPRGAWRVVLRTPGGWRLYKRA